MTDRLHYSTVRPIAGRINQLAGVSPSGAPLRGRGDWIPGAITLENSSYGAWQVCRVTNARGGVKTIHSGKLRDCKAFLDGMELALRMAQSMAKSPSLG